MGELDGEELLTVVLGEQAFDEEFRLPQPAGRAAGDDDAEVIDVAERDAAAGCGCCVTTAGLRLPAASKQRAERRLKRGRAHRRCRDDARRAEFAVECARQVVQRRDGVETRVVVERDREAELVEQRLHKSEELINRHVLPRVEDDRAVELTPDAHVQLERLGDVVHQRAQFEALGEGLERDDPLRRRGGVGAFHECRVVPAGLAPHHLSAAITGGGLGLGALIEQPLATLGARHVAQAAVVVGLVFPVRRLQPRRGRGGRRAERD